MCLLTWEATTEVSVVMLLTLAVRHLGSTSTQHDCHNCGAIARIGDRALDL